MVARGARRHHGTVLHGHRRHGGGTIAGRHACRHGLHLERATHRRELPHVRRVDPGRHHGAAAEAVGGNAHHRVVDVHVPVHVDVLYVHHRRIVDDHIVHDAWATPAMPAGHADEAASPPPWNAGLTPAEGGPVHGPAEAHAHLH